MQLLYIKTSDGLVLPGYYESVKSKRCAVFVHGLCWHAHPDFLVRALGQAFNRAHWDFLSFDNRGAHILAWLLKGNNSKKIGGAAERFEDCVKDIAAALDSIPHKKAVLIGHSTGCQKSIYYINRTHDPRVRGLVLLGPASDVDYEKKRFGKKYWYYVKKAERMVKAGQGWKLFEKEDLTAARFYSLYKKGSKEGSIFNYATGKMPALSKIDIPMLAVYGSKDKYSVYGPQRELAMLRAAGVRDTAIIKGAEHGFEGKEAQTAALVVRWAKKVIK